MKTVQLHRDGGQEVTSHPNIIRASVAADCADAAHRGGVDPEETPVTLSVQSLINFSLNWLKILHQTGLMSLCKHWRHTVAGCLMLLPYSTLLVAAGLSVDKILLSFCWQLTAMRSSRISFFNSCEYSSVVFN